jgi:apolipoprotein N-acyltransferase
MILGTIHSQTISNLAMPVLSGLLLFLSFPMFGSGILAWLALIPLFYALRNAKPLEGFKLGFITGLIAHCGILYWISYVVVQYGNLPIYIGIMAVLLLAAYLSLYTACFAMGLVFLRTRGNAVFLAAPFLWTVLEYARSNLLTGFPWENLAHSQYLYRNIIQIADITGTYGITFTIVLINAVLYNVIFSKINKKRYHISEIAIAFTLLVMIYGYGHYRTAEIEKLLKTSSPFEVSLVQGNIDQNLKWNKHYQFETLDIYRSLTLSAIPAQGGLVVWPETAAPFYFERPETLREMVIELSRFAGRAMLFGSPRYEDEDGRTSFMNSAYLLEPGGVIAGRYDKVHLVPYGEYVPLRKLFPFIGKIVSGVGDFRPGKGFDPLENNGRRFGVLICYEGIFPEAARDYKRNRADLLVNITNDAWFGKTSAPYQHLSMTIFRSIETRLYLVRAANTGISAVVDPTGVIVSKTGVFERTVLKGQVKLIDVKTLYAAYGDIFVYICFLSMILNDFMQRRRRKYAGRNP